MILDIWRIVLQWQGGRRRHPRGAASLPVSRRRRREKTAGKRTGEVRPAFSRAQSGARAAPARYARPRRHRRAQDTRESGSRRRAGRPQAGWNGVERNGMEERHAGMRKRGPETPPPASGERAEAAAEKPSPPGRGLGEGPQAGEGKKGASDGGRQARPYDRTGDRICARSMPIMTFHDISREGRRPPGPLPVIPPYRHARTCSGQPYGRAAEAVEVDARNKSTAVRFIFVDGLHGIDSTGVQALANVLDRKEAQCHAPPQ